MKFIRPNTINDAALVSSNVPEDDYPSWNSETIYAIGDKVIKNHRVWESLQAENTNHDPETSGTWWAGLEATNRWKMFDGKVYTETVANQLIEVKLAPGRIDSIALLNVDAASVTVEIKLGAEVLFTRTISLVDSAPITDWYQYFFEPIIGREYVLIENLPIFGDAETTVRIERNFGAVKCGMCIVGMKSDLGKALSSPALGINDYSRKDIDQFGNASLVQRNFAKRMRVKLLMPNSEVDRVHLALSQIRATPVVWIGSAEFSSMLIYGFYRDFDVDLAYSQHSYCTLNIEGMI